MGVNNGQVRVRVSTTLACSIDAAWEALHTPGVFTRVSAPFTRFRPVDSALPERFDTDTDYRVTVLAFGLIPIGRQTIRLVDQVDHWATRSTTDVGHGDSGALAQLSGWRHQMRLQARPDGHTDFRDELQAKAGVLTPFAWLGLQVFWWWRASRLRRIALSLDAPITGAWNSRYAGKQSMWSGKVNPVVAEVTSTLTPGRALDVGCGEGADALFLAESGWTTLGVEASSVALYRAHTEQRQREATTASALPVTWRVADIGALWDWRDGEYDLVSLQFVHTDQATRERIWREALSAVAPGGTLLIVGHDPADASLGIPRPPADMCFNEDDLRNAVPSHWSAVETSTRRRTQVIAGEEVQVADVVLRATR